MKLGSWIAGSLVALSFLFTASARADHLYGLQQDAAALDGYAHALCAEVRSNLRHAQNFPVIVAKVEAWESRIHLLQDVVARPVSQQQLYAHLDVVDRLALSVEDCVFDAARGRAWGHHDLHTQGAERLLRVIDNTIHHMEEHVDHLRDCDLRPVQQPIIHQRPVWSPYQNPNSGQPGTNGPSWNHQVPSQWNGGYPSPQPQGWNQPTTHNGFRGSWQQILIDQLQRAR